MEHDYELNIESWASSIIELEEHTGQKKPHYYDAPSSSNSSIISLESPTYYRTKAFSSTIGINNLINAADPLLTLVTKLRRISIPPDFSILYQNICHEIKAFENKAQTLGYRSQLILAARYILCSLLDELLAITLWPETEWKKYSFVESFHKDMWQEDRFFLILERSLQDPTGHIDLLEMIYLCLRFGYEGKYRGMERGHFELRNITDHLYNVITHYREEFSRSLLIAVDNPNYRQLPKKSYFHLLPSAWVISTLMIITLLVIFTFFYLKLIEAASPVTQFLNTLQQGQNVAMPKIAK